MYYFDRYKSNISLLHNVILDGSTFHAIQFQAQWKRAVGRWAKAPKRTLKRRIWLTEAVNCITHMWKRLLSYWSQVRFLPVVPFPL